MKGRQKMTQEIERLYAWNVRLPSNITTRATALKTAETYCTTSPEKHLSNKHGYFKDEPNWLVYPAGVCSVAGLILLPGIFIGFPIMPMGLLAFGAYFWLFSIGLWKISNPTKLVQYKTEWQKQHELATDKLSVAAKNLVAITEFLNKQVNRFNKYQRYIESGVVSLDEAQLTERKELHARLKAIHAKIQKRADQLDYLLDTETKPALDQEVMEMIDLLGQAEIGNEITKLLDPRFRTLTEAEMETKALSVLEELPQII